MNVKNAYACYKDEAKYTPKNYIVYDSICTILSTLRKLQPISCVFDKEKKVYAIVNPMFIEPKEINTLYGINIKVEKSKEMKSLSMCFFNVSCDFNYDDVQITVLKSSDITHFLLFLPELDNIGYQTGTKDEINAYYIIDYEWNELDENLNFLNQNVQM